MENSTEQLKRILEAILFVSSGTVPIDQVAKFLDISVKDVKELINTMNENYAENRGLRILIHKNRAQLTTAPDLGEQIEEFLGLELTTTLSRAALEAISIIAYKQPITRPQIEEIRGVNSDGVVRTLLSKGLVHEVGRADTLGKPILYGTTEDFLHYFGLQSIGELPMIENQTLAGGKPTHAILKQ